MGINALENIKYIGDTRIIKSERTQYAVDWHIWKNYGYTLFLIVATDSIEENKQLYEECIKKLRSMLLSVIIHSELGMKMKTKMLVQGLFPVSWAKRSLNKQLKEFKLDSME